MVVVVVAGGKWEVSNCKSVSPVFPRTESPPQKETRSEAAETRLWLSIEDSSKTSLPAPTFHRLRPPAPPHTLRFLALRAHTRAGTLPRVQDGLHFS